MSTEHLIDLIYEAALMLDRWAGVLENLTTFASGIGTVLVSSHDAHSQAISTASVAHVVAAMKTPEWAGRNIRGQLPLSLAQAQFHSDADHYTEEQMERDPLYRDLAWPSGIGHAAATWIAVPNGDNLILSVKRPRKEG